MAIRVQSQDSQVGATLEGALNHWYFDNRPAGNDKYTHPARHGVANATLDNPETVPHKPVRADHTEATPRSVRANPALTW